MAYIKCVNVDYEGHIVIIFNGNHKIFGSYIPPRDSMYFSEQCFYEIINILEPINSNYVIFGGGDMNSRIGNLFKSLRPPTNDSFYRNNIDDITNSHGQLLYDICKAYKYYSLNNLTIYNTEFDGKFTFQKDIRKSQNDVCITNKTGLKNISAFKIYDDITFNFSDHTPISVTAEFQIDITPRYSQVTQDLLSQSCSHNDNRQRKINDKLVNWEAYINSTTRDLAQLQNHVIANQNYSSVDDILYALDNTMYKTATILQTKPPKSTVPSRTYTVETRTVSEISQQVANNDTEKWEKIINNKNIRELWKEIAWDSTSYDSSYNYPPTEKLGEHFQNKSKISNEEYFSFDHQKWKDVPVLDYEIAQDEITDATKKLKENRSSADGWTPSMITKILGTLIPLLVILFNTIFKFASFPTKWTTTVVSAIFKNKGSRLSEKNYRPISLVHLLSKLFDFILLKRFMNWFKPHDCQTAYQHGKSCADHIFILRSLTEYCKSKKEKLFIICIDFEGAFDKVSRHKLFKKLQIFGVGSTFLLSLISIYSVTDSIIYGQDTSFAYHLLAGIKQGLPLSPWLFLFYINDIFDLFDALHENNNILEKLHLLIHADDTTILANTRDSAKRKINTLISYCKQNYIALQISKCEFIVINGNPEDKIDFILPNGVIKNVRHVTLLGSQISESGNISYDIDLHIQKRFIAVHKFYNFMKTNKLAPVAVKIKVLQACVISSLLHNCEAFGKVIPKQLEKIYYSLIKCVLNVRSNAPNKLVLIESGLPPLESLIYARQFNFIKRFIDLHPYSTRKKVFDHIRLGNSKYINHYMNLLQNYNSKDDIYKYYVDTLKQDIYNLASFDKNYKYRLYVKFNPNLEVANLSTWALKSLSKIRLSSHSFPIETGRYTRVKREDRLCINCNKLGDEVHYIYECLSIDRTDINNIPTLDKLNEYKDLAPLMRNLKLYL